jgi:hypothetical protein
MLFAGALAIKKRLRTWNIGRAQTWMRGHLWLGLLTLPLILFHGGFAWRGPLTFVLMILLFFVIASGIFGAVLQHYMPTFITAQAQRETIYEEVPHVQSELRMEAEKLLGSAGALAVSPRDLLVLNESFRMKIRPYLEDPDHPHAGGVALATVKGSAETFYTIRKELPPALTQVVDDLEKIVGEARQLNRQRMLQRVLQGWLLIHIPTSTAVILLGGIHAVVALLY